MRSAGYEIPDNKLVNQALSEMFAETMHLKKKLSPKMNRDFVSVLIDYIAPSSLAKTSTTEQMASLFHHSRAIHNQYYSAETFRRDKDGNIIPGPLHIAQQIWTALGEMENSSHVTSLRPNINNIILTRDDYSYTAKRAYKDKSASVNDLQYAAILHASSKEITKHAFVFMGCGMGKSGIYNLLLLGAYLHRAPVPRTIVISPHNSLLSMHKLQSRQYFRGTNLTVSSLLPVDVQNEHYPNYFDLLFISIHAFNDLMVGSRDIILGWQIKNVFVDEYHNIVGELFRFSSSWQSMRYITALNAKVMLLSATMDKKLMGYIADFMSLGEYEVIGSPSHYIVPEVCINIHSRAGITYRETLMDLVVSKCKELFHQKSHKKFKIHAITMSKQDATELSERLNNAGLQSMWLTSSLPPQQKTQCLQRWEEGTEQVLVSTFTDGIDNSATEDVIIVGATYSIYNLVQAIGRIRPRRQNIKNASVHIFHSPKYMQVDELEIDDTVSRAVGGKVFPIEDMSSTIQYYRKFFHMSGYKNWIEEKSCYRKTLYNHFQIDSPLCNHCSNCKQQNFVNRSAILTETFIAREDLQRTVVQKAIRSMLTTCLVCSSPNCNGIQCFPPKPNRCFCCHVAINRATFHKSSQCPADTSSKKIDTKGNSCPGCFMTFSKDMPERGNNEDHLNNKCPHQKRIKRVLLYGVETAKDPGISARRLLVSVLSNPTHWYNVMATNIGIITSRKAK